MHTNTSIPHLLVVDDDEDFARLLERTLSNDGYRVTYALSGETALKLLAELPIDLVLLDIHMPGLDGFETCRRIKSAPTTLGVPVIFLTADRRSNAALAAALSVGGTDYLTKPLSRADVVARVRTAIHQRLESLWLRRLDAEDTLTGLPGRNYFRSRIEEELSDCGRFHTPVSLVMAELQGLKQVHAEYGTAVGDAWVARFGLLLRAESRRHDVVARLNESRFGLLLPRVGPPGAGSAVRRMSDIWRLTTLSNGKTEPSVPAVFATVSYDGGSPPPSAGDLLQRAGEAVAHAAPLGMPMLATPAVPGMLSQVAAG